MPIAREEFESYDPTAHRTNAERVLSFLEERRGQAFKALEIAEAAGVHEHSIHPVLGRLEAEGVVEHKSPYWALADEGRRDDDHEGRLEDDHEGPRDDGGEGKQHWRRRRGPKRDHDRPGDHDGKEWPKSVVRPHRPRR